MINVPYEQDVEYLDRYFPKESGFRGHAMTLLGIARCIGFNNGINEIIKQERAMIREEKKKNQKVYKD
jgi:hypothetical protein